MEFCGHGVKISYPCEECLKYSAKIEDMRGIHITDPHFGIDYSREFIGEIFPPTEDQIKQLAALTLCVDFPKYDKEHRIDQLRGAHHGRDCIICFEKVCVCKPRS